MNSCNVVELVNVLKTELSGPVARAGEAVLKQVEIYSYLSGGAAILLFLVLCFILFLGFKYLKDFLREEDIECVFAVGGLTFIVGGVLFFLILCFGYDWYTSTFNPDYAAIERVMSLVQK